MKRREHSQSVHTKFSRALLRWYDRNRRLLPWRTNPATPQAKPHPYAVLVSEFMLQQTQVVTVIPYFQRFMSRFPTMSSLASADEQDVLRLWQGLGYYSRARNLLACAKTICADFAGQVPSSVQALQTLPGIGRYTAGAIASIAFGARAPIVDGNVARVLCRIDLIKTDPRSPATLQHLWKRAEGLLPKTRTGDFNSALMELGATLCTPKSPQCLICPVRTHCRASASGLQESIPPPRKAKPVPVERRWTICVSDQKRWLIEQRPAKGRWAGMWQFVTLQANGRSKSATFSRHLGFKVSVPQSIGQVKHLLTHRQYIFDIYSAQAKFKNAEDANRAGRTRRWVLANELHLYPLPKPHLRIADMLDRGPGRQG